MSRSEGEEQKHESPNELADQRDQMVAELVRQESQAGNAFSSGRWTFRFVVGSIALHAGELEESLRRLLDVHLDGRKRAFGGGQLCRLQDLRVAEASSVSLVYRYQARCVYRTSELSCLSFQARFCDEAAWIERGFEGVRLQETCQRRASADVGGTRAKERVEGGMETSPGRSFHR